MRNGLAVAAPGRGMTRRRASGFLDVRADAGCRIRWTPAEAGSALWRGVLAAHSAWSSGVAVVVHWHVGTDNLILSRDEHADGAVAHRVEEYPVAQSV